jgi:hypothetical protein
MIEKGDKMTTIFKTKSQLRVETETAVKRFIKSGGSVEVVKPRKAPKQYMRGKTTRVGSTGTSGFATGYPKRSTLI